MGMGWDDGKPNMGRDGDEIDGLGRQGDSWQRRSRLLASVHMSIVLLLVASIYSIVCLSWGEGGLNEPTRPSGSSVLGLSVPLRYFPHQAPPPNRHETHEVIVDLWALAGFRLPKMGEGRGSYRVGRWTGQHVTPR